MKRVAILRVCDLIAIACFFIVFIKVPFYFIISSFGIGYFGGGNDADYYHAYALGEGDVAVNIWPEMLKKLNSVGLYSRELVSYFLMAVSAVVLPVLLGYIVSFSKRSSLSKYSLLVALCISLYPTVVFFSLDIYRDMVMILFFTVGLLFVRRFTVSNDIWPRVFCFIAISIISIFLFNIRHYLGVSFFSAFCLFYILPVHRFPLIIWGVGYMLTLTILFWVGALNVLVEYRQLFDSTQGGSSFGIRFDSVATFPMLYLKSFFYQVFGLYFPNKSAVLVFVMESIPFALGFWYLLRNRPYFNFFVRYLFVFFFIYTTIWVLGNDNMGTAVRLRMLSYIPVLLACVLVYQQKKNYRRVRS